MRGFPKKINTGQDLFNCLALAKAGEVSKEDIRREIERIESRGFIHCPIVDISDDRKTVTIRYCNEATSGQIANGITITGVEHTTGEDDTPENTIITMEKPLPSEATALLLPSPTDPLAALGLTQAQLDSIKEALSNE